MQDCASQTVSEVVWPWRRLKAAAPGPASARSSMLRRGLVQAAVAVVAAILLYFWLGNRIMAGVVLGIGLAVVFCAFFIPPAYRAIERFGQFLGWLAGTALTYLLLVPFFYLCFVPARIILAARGSDPMRRGFDKSAESYWTPYMRRPSADAYKRQY